MIDYKKRCEDCACLIVNGKVWCCDEMWGRPCSEVDECPEGIEVEEIQEIEEKTKNVKIDHGVSSVSEQKKAKKPRTVKISDEKTEIFEYLTDILPKNYDITILKQNKLIEISYNGKKFKLDLIEQRQKKA